jgi:hypothetical protein
MANKIQIKRSTANATVTGLANGELAFTQASNTLHIGLPDGSGVLRIGGAQYPGTLTNNHALVANSIGSIDNVITANLAPTRIWANGTSGSAGQVLLSAGSSSNVYWVDANTLSTDPAGSNTQIQFNDSGSLGASEGFVFDKSTNTLSVVNTISVGNSSVNTQIAAGNVFLNGSTLVVGNTASNVTVNNTTIAIGTTIVNSTTFTGTSNNALYLGGVIASDYQTTAGLSGNVATLTANNANNLGGVAAANYVQNTDSRTLSGNLTFTGANLSISGTNTSITSNTTIAGSLTTISSNVNISGAAINATSATLRVLDAEISGNLTINGTLTTINTNSLSVKDALIKIADNNTTSDTIDFGIYGVSGNSITTWYSGLYRDHAASGLTSPVFKLFVSNTEPTSIVDNTATGYVLGTLNAYLTGSGLVSNSTVTNITANSSVSVAIVANTLSLTTALAGNSGGTGHTTAPNNSILVGNSTNGYTQLSLGTTGQVLQSNGTALVYDTLDGGTF